MHYSIGVPELIFITLLALVLFGCRIGPRSTRPPHPIPGDDSRLLNRRRRGELHL
jgi:hypothetical protein